MKKASKSIVALLFTLVLICTMAVPAFAASVGKVKTLKASKTTYNSVTLTWSAVSKVTGYNIEQYNTAKKKWTKVASTNSKTTSKTVTGLKTGTTYSFRVNAYTKSRFGRITYGGYSSAIKAKPMPAKITSFKSSSTTSTITLKWSAISKATGYKIQVYSGNKWKDYKTLKGEKTTSLTIKKLKINTTYTYRIAAYNTVGKANYVGPYSSALKVKTGLKAPSAKASSITYTSAKISWGAVSETTGYRIERYVNKKWVGVAVIKNAKTTSYTMSNLTPSTTYYIRVLAYKTISGKNYWSPASANVKFVTPRPSNVRGVKASSITTTSAKISWSKISGVTGYRLEFLENGAWKAVVLKGDSTVSYTKSGLIPGTSYQVRVRAYKAANGKNYWSPDYTNIKFATSKLGTVSGVKASNITASSAKFSWSKVSGVTGYRFEILDNGAWKATVLKGDSTVSYTKSGLIPGTSYQVRVRSYKNINGKNYYGAWSSVYKFNTSAVSKVQNVEATLNSNNTISISWSKISGISGYDIQASTDGGKKYATIGSTAGASAYLYDNVPRTNIMIRVRTYITVGGKNYYGAYSDPASVDNRIPAVTDLTASDKKEHSVKLSWEAVSSVESYEITYGDKKLTTKETSIVIDGLEPGTEYKFTVKARIGNYASAGTSTSAKTFIGNVTGVSTYPVCSVDNSINDIYATIFWDKVKGADGYTVYTDDKDIDDVTVAEDTTASKQNWARIDYLKKDRIYKFTVRAFVIMDGKRVYSDLSDTVRASTGKYTLSVSNKVTSNIKDAGMLKWNTIEGATAILEKSTFSNGTTIFETRPTSVDGEYLVEGTSEFNVKAERSGEGLTKISWDDTANNRPYTVQAANTKTGVWYTLGRTASGAKSLTVCLAPENSYNFRVVSDFATEKYKLSMKLDETDSVFGNPITQTVTYPLRYGVSEVYTVPAAAALSASSSNNVKTLYILQAVEALNATKYDKSKKLTVKVDTNADASLEDTRANGKIGILPIINLDLKGLLDFVERYVGDTGIDLDEFTKDLKESSSETFTFTDGVTKRSYLESQYLFDGKGNILTSTDSSGNVTKRTKNNVVTKSYAISDLVPPSAELASFYGWNNVDSLGSKVKSVSSTKNGDKTEITIVLNAENSKSGAPVHTGFEDKLAEMLSSFDEASSDGTLSNVVATIGDKVSFNGKNYDGTVLKFVINKDGTLDSYSVLSPYTLKVDMALKDSESVKIDITISLNMKGTFSYTYSFTR